jgi:hypothetical protein
MGAWSAPRLAERGCLSMPKTKPATRNATPAASACGCSRALISAEPVAERNIAA